MLYPVQQAEVCFVACHGGPADHFWKFAEGLSENYVVEIQASGPALKKVEESLVSEKGVAVKKFSIEGLTLAEQDILAEEIARVYSTASKVIVDVGNSFSYKVLEALARIAPHVIRVAHYDNPESHVEGGYSELAAKVMLAAQVILFANSNLATAPIFEKTGTEVDFGDRVRIGIGYYPVHQALETIKRRSEDRLEMRNELFEKNELTDNGQKVLVYFGGNNDKYFKEFSFFLSLLEGTMEKTDLSHLVIVLQQHPGAKNENRDRHLAEVWANRHKDALNAPKIVISHCDSSSAQVFACAALYNQTSMGPLFALAGIPTAQISSEKYLDILVSNELCPSVGNADQFTCFINNLVHPHEEISHDVILQGLGIKENWLEILNSAMKVE